MPTLTNLIAFALVALGMVLTPGPNMIYLVSRSICQGPRAGLVSLAGIALGFVFYLLCAAFGITAIFMAVPFAYDALRAAGALYLLWLAWQAIRPGGHSPFAVRALPPESPRRLFSMGLVTALFNPKVAVLYLSLLPQFIVPGHGSLLTQALMLGVAQICVSIARECRRHRDGGQHRGLSGTAPRLVGGAALADGHRAGRAGDPRMATEARR